MKYYLVLIVLTIFLLEVFAEGKKEIAEYDLALQALAYGDCVSAIKHLESYKEKNKNYIEQYPEFFRKIDEQIELCRIKEEEKMSRPKRIFGAF